MSPATKDTWPAANRYQGLALRGLNHRTPMTIAAAAERPRAS
jgi:hypothetical protein